MVPQHILSVSPNLGKVLLTKLSVTQIEPWVARSPPAIKVCRATNSIRRGQQSSLWEWLWLRDYREIADPLLALITSISSNLTQIANV